MARYFKRASTEKRKKSNSKTRIRSSKKWIDPFPHVHGTLPEKMVYAELTRLGIPFYFLNDLRFKIPEINFDKYYQADFYIPAGKLIIEVQGAYWHSMKKTQESDAFKFTIYETAGYKILAWWDYDIIARLHDLISDTPELLKLANPANRPKSTELTPMRRTKIDTSKGIRTLNARRKKQAAPKVKLRTLRSSKSAYQIT